MNSPSPAGLSPQECLRLLVEHRRTWLVPTAICALLALGYALVMSRNWEASQALVVRREVNTSSTVRPGKFSDLFEMRTFQETILELAKSQQVISATLQVVEQSEAPSDKEIEEFRKRMSMSPPGGAEFGETEVFYLSVKNKNRDRAIALVSELCKQLDLRLRKLRETQAQSLITELQQQVDQASAVHDAQTQKLAEFEARVGTDLGELRMLNASYSGQSDLRQQSINLEREIQQAQIQTRDAEQLLVILEKARNEPEQLVAMPSSLLTSQPTLRQLKDGLVTAQLNAARLMGTRTKEHPQVQAAHDEVQRIRQDLRDELQVAFQGVQVELELSRNRSANLIKQSADLKTRLSNLAELRAEYANHVSATENSRLVLDQARKQLGEVLATQTAAQNVSLVTTIDKPDTGPNPVGLGRSSVLLMGTMGGLVLGLGWLFLTVSPSPVPSEPTAPSTVAVKVPDAPVAQPNVSITPVEERTAAKLATSRPAAGVSPSVAARIAEIMGSASVSGSSESALHSVSSSTANRSYPN